LFRKQGYIFDYQYDWVLKRMVRDYFFNLILQLQTNFVSNDNGSKQSQGSNELKQSQSSNELFADYEKPSLKHLNVHLGDLEKPSSHSNLFLAHRRGEEIKDLARSRSRRNSLADFFRKK
jgi:hypothetical protein